ncbi:hydantoinase B/oxoprolinase family protein [Amycolatopsis jejuensis]|uniref:hydantoinase B/oxoprolinase family protein n=1 Tax=Amycolatopsis jejuensis TaxID=330084 RepID=UPI000A03AF57|nr:hydantoinase B/oxoprolinase family protein [Amycolatopsis jejuensis]
MTAPVDLEILRTTLVAHTGETAAMLAHAAAVTEISESRDFCVAIADARGGIVATDNPAQLGSLASSVAGLLDYFEFDLKDGDVVLTNGGTRVSDLTLLTPLVSGNELLLHLVVRVPVRDLGGQVGGNRYPIATELLAEGVPVTPVKIQRLGRPSRDVRTTLVLNSRRPQETERILDGALAALASAHRRLGALVAGRGAATVRSALEYTQDYSERLARAAISRWKCGSFPGSATIPGEPSGGGPVAIRVQATVDSAGLTLDFSESDDQRPSFVNCPEGVTASCALRAVLACLGDSVPADSGLLRAVRVVTRPGTITHPTPSAPVGWGGEHGGNEVTEAVAAALRSATGAPVPVLTAPRPLVLSRTRADRSDQTDLGRWAVGGAGAAPGFDGWGGPALSARALLPSVEQWEAEHRMRVHRLEFAADTAGAGRWTGAPGVEAVLELPPDRRYTLWTEPAGPPAAALAGAVAGRPGEVSLHTENGWEPAPATAVERPLDGDLLRILLPGGGGHGDPRTRDRAAVAADLADGLLTADRARAVYGIDPERGSDA